MDAGLILCFLVFELRLLKDFVFTTTTVSEKFIYTTGAVKYEQDLLLLYLFSVVSRRTRMSGSGSEERSRRSQVSSSNSYSSMDVSYLLRAYRSTRAGEIERAPISRYKKARSLFRTLQKYLGYTC